MLSNEKGIGNFTALEPEETYSVFVETEKKIFSLYTIADIMNNTSQNQGNNCIESSVNNWYEKIPEDQKEREDNQVINPLCTQSPKLSPEMLDTPWIIFKVDEGKEIDKNMEKGIKDYSKTKVGEVKDVADTLSLIQPVAAHEQSHLINTVGSGDPRVANIKHGLSRNVNILKGVNKQAKYIEHKVIKKKIVPFGRRRPVP